MKSHDVNDKIAWTEKYLAAMIRRDREDVAMMKAIFAAVVLFALTATSSAQTTYPTQALAAKHCRSTVVWLNIPTGVYHYPGTRWYGVTRDGGYVCQTAADKAGDHPARNGQ